jgi:hypothetical protein
LSPPSPIPLDPDSCSIDQVEIVVNATLETIEKPIGPLYFVVYFSQDWTSWHQASKIDLNDAIFDWRDCPALNGSADPACRNSTEPGKRMPKLWPCIKCRPRTLAFCRSPLFM